jgi:trehalose 6-phosphate phosphatase
MSGDGSNLRDLPHALADGDTLIERLAGKRPAVFLDYDGTLTPIVDRPEDAIISAACARRCANWRRARPSA